MKRFLFLACLLLLPALSFAQTSVIVRGKISTANATTTPLANAGVFTGSWESSRDYTTLTVVVFADKASAAGGLQVQWSSDAANVDLTDTYSVSANVGATWTTVSKDAFFRVVYTNGAVTQTVFRLSAIMRQSGAPGYAENNLTDTQLRATPVPINGTVTANVGTGTQPVSGTFWQVTQPVSGTFWQTTQPVSGTFWQTTQPVSGTFWQATQPVSGPLTDAQLRATPVPVSGAFFQATQPVSNAGLTNVDVALSTRLKPADTLTAVTTVGTITNPVAVTSAGLTNLDAALSTRLKPADTLTGVTTVATVTNLATIGTSVTPGTAAANLGKAEDAAHASSDTGVMDLAVRKETTAQITSADGDYSPFTVDGYGTLMVRQDHVNRIQCRLTTSATTSTVVTGCAAPGAGLAIYITDYQIYGGVATGATAAATIQSGTGGTCGTGTIINTYCQHAATSGCNGNQSTPTRAVTNGEVCLLDATVGTKFVVLNGFIAP